jgi:hypothetical protein
VKFIVSDVLTLLVNAILVLELKGFHHYVHPVMMDFTQLIQPECKIVKPATLLALLVMDFLLIIVWVVQFKGI